MAKPINKVITGKDTRWAYVNVWESKMPLRGGKPLYSVQLIIPKSSVGTVEKIKNAMRAAYYDDINKLKGRDSTVPAFEDLKLPLRDGDKDRPLDPAYANCWFINANSPEPPGVVDADLQPIFSHNRVYSGVYGRASISFYAFNRDGVKGIACCLLNLQKIRDGQPLGTRSSAQEDFSEN